MNVQEVFLSGPLFWARAVGILMPGAREVGGGRDVFSFLYPQKRKYPSFWPIITLFEKGETLKFLDIKKRAF